MYLCGYLSVTINMCDGMLVCESMCEYLCVICAYIFI